MTLLADDRNGIRPVKISHIRKPQSFFGSLPNTWPTWSNLWNKAEVAVVVLVVVNTLVVD